MKIYANRFSELDYQAESNLLIETWLADSKTLTEIGVQHEIGQLLNFTNELKIKNIIVDAREYPFRENNQIQNWINYSYVPQLIESGIVKYAIITSSNVQSHQTNILETEDMMQVEYFKNFESALLWINK